MRHLRSATITCAAALAVFVGEPPDSSDDPPDQDPGACVDRLLDVASADTDSFPALVVITDQEFAMELADQMGVDGEIGCLARDQAADITYIIVEGGVDTEVDTAGTVALGSGLVIIEPGGDPGARLDDPGPTWSDVDGIGELVDRFSLDSAIAVELGLPDPDRSPVRVLGRSTEWVGEGSDRHQGWHVVWRFAEGAAAAHVEEIESMLAGHGLEPVSVDVGDDDISAVIEGESVPPLIELAMLDDEIDTAGEAQRFPDVIDVAVDCADDGYDFAVTISSPYDTPERYADGWRVVGPDGTVYGEHQLAHDHAAEQPFTRTQSGVPIPADVDEVVVEGHDLANGYGGQTVTVALPDCE